MRGVPYTDGLLPRRDFQFCRAVLLCRTALSRSSVTCIRAQVERSGPSIVQTADCQPRTERRSPTTDVTSAFPETWRRGHNGNPTCIDPANLERRIKHQRPPTDAGAVAVLSGSGVMAGCAQESVLDFEARNAGRSLKCHRSSGFRRWSRTASRASTEAVTAGAAQPR